VVREPDGAGFGSRLLQVTAAELRGDMAVRWNPDGLAWSLSLPLEMSDFELPA
jgi:two-component sensor histidine kinase